MLGIEMCATSLFSFTDRNDSWVPVGFLIKNAYMSFMFSDWIGSLTDGFFPTTTTNKLILIYPFTFFSSFFKLISTSNGCPLHQSNDVLLSSLSCWKDFLLFLLPLPGTGCTEYLWTETQRKKEGTLLIGSANMAWRTAQPSSASFSAPPVRLPSCSDTWPRKVNLSLWEDQPHDRFVFVCVYVCECVFVCWFQQICQHSFPLCCPCVRLLLINLPGTAALAFESHLGCKWNLKEKGVALW